MRVFFQKNVFFLFLPLFCSFLALLIPLYEVEGLSFMDYGLENKF